MFRFTLNDLLINAFDSTVQPGGVLVVQDDLGDGELPYDRLKRELAAIGFELVDFRQESRGWTGRGKAHGTRPIEQCTATLDHQMAAWIEDPKRCKSIPSHSCVLPRYVVLLHPIRAYMYHAGVGNKYTIGIEHAARAAGIEDNPLTFWRSTTDKLRGRKYEDLVHEVTDPMLAASLLLHQYYADEVARQGGALVAAEFHRNTSKSRVSDPGSRIALGVTLPFALERGLQYGGPVVGTGLPTPTVWGGPPGVPYSWRVRGW